MQSILVIDDERSIRNILKEILQYESYQVDDAKDGNEGLEKIKNKHYDLVICDIKMPGIDGLEVLEKAKEFREDIQFIMISGHGTMETAVEATKKGAFDYLEKPPDMNRLLVSVRNALEKKSLVTETKNLKKKISKSTSIIGESTSLQNILETAHKVASTDARVLILGPNGTGKELFAKYIHENSHRNKAPLVEVNCAAIPSELIESELFGHEKGAFTSAVKQRIGKFEQAHGGTLFLDEIGDMSLSAQAKVLRALQENKITRVGGEKEIPINVRVIAATNKDLQKEILLGNFREDLYHRLGVVILNIPPLKDRKEDIPLLAHHFIQLICEEYHYPIKPIHQDAIELLKTLDWTGNIREFRNAIERLVIFCDKSIEAKDVEKYVLSNSFSTKSYEIYEKFNSLQEFLNYSEKEFLIRKLSKNQWNIAITSEEILLSIEELTQKIQKYQIQKPQSL
jgi:DNA-binding NtrC family response regulator